MGLFDGLGSVEQEQYDQYIQQAKLDHETQMRRMQLNNAMSQGVISGTGIYNTAIGAQKAMQPKERFDPNKIEAFQIPLSQVVTMWRLKYGDEWVDALRPNDASFYAHAHRRLSESELFENVQGWVRLKEGLA